MLDIVAICFLHDYQVGILFIHFILLGQFYRPWLLGVEYVGRPFIAVAFQFQLVSYFGVANVGQ
jgi:hypothetical protein